MHVWLLSVTVNHVHGGLHAYLITTNLHLLSFYIPQGELSKSHLIPSRTCLQ